MILLLWIPLICGIVIPIVLHKKGKIDMDEDIEHFIGWMLCIFGGVALLLVCIIAPISHGATAAEYTTFYETNNLNYGIAVDETASYLSQETFENQFIAGSLEKVGLAGFISERIKEWRDDVNQFNLNLARYKYYEDHPFLGVLYPDTPDYLKTLVIK